MSRPQLKIVGLHIEGLRALRRVDWPANGFGWADTVPEMVMVGGINGSGKTTLLEFISACVGVVGAATSIGHEPVAAPHAAIDFHLATAAGEARFRVIFDESAIEIGSRGRNGAFSEFPQEAGLFADPKDTHLIADFLGHVRNDEDFARSGLPGVLYLPSDRDLVIPETTFKSPAQIKYPDSFFFRFARPHTWIESPDALFYAARWADLNAKEEGRPDEAHQFEDYTRTFRGFFAGKKEMVWKGGELLVQITDTGRLHDLSSLSSGEKQVIVLGAEILRRWRPGSLILIDEPELHLHPHWQTLLWSLLTEWQRERGGQVIVTTQSSDLFRIADPESQVLLGREPL